MKENGVDPVRRCLSFAAGLALNQHAPQVALEILSNSRNSNYVSIRNLKLWSLADLNRPDDCLPILRFSIEFDAGTENKGEIVEQGPVRLVDLVARRKSILAVAVQSVAELSPACHYVSVGVV